MRQRVDEFGKVRTNACEKVRRGYLRMGEHGGRYLYEMEGADEEEMDAIRTNLEEDIDGTDGDSGRVGPTRGLEHRRQSLTGCGVGVGEIKSRWLPGHGRGKSQGK